MIWRSGKASRTTLVALALFSVLVFILAELTARPEKQRYFEEKLKAANLAALAQATIRGYGEGIGLKVDPQNDPFRTGVIGQERTELTTDRGIVASKILSTNPNFAAAFIALLHQAGLKPHDVVAVGMTGSFPGWNIAFLAACKALDLRPLIITSVGSSDWGANIPSLTWLDMERILDEKGLWNFRSVAASIGGASDSGRGLSPEGRDLIREAIRRNGALLIQEGNLEASILKRLEIYEAARKGQKIACYVNIGGGAASVGGTRNAKLIPAGLSRHLAVRNFPVRGVINRMAEEGIPVIHLHSVKKLAPRYDLPDTVTDKAPEVGQGKLYFKDRYSVTNTIFLTAALALVLFIFIRVDVKHYLFRKKLAPRYASTGEGGKDESA
jgi:poly-gamma-glutamate system protein